MSSPVSKEDLRTSLQTSLDSERSLAQRNELGQHATPPALANSIARVAVGFLPKRSRVKFFEPSIGTGSFFSALLNTIARSRLQSARGFEIDDRLAKAARKLWADEGLVVTVGDFAKASPAQGEKYSLVLANPPYVRHHHLDATTKASLQLAAASKLGLKVSGLAGLYVHFLLQSYQWMEEGGVAAWLLPSEWMDVNYGTALKEFLLNRVQLLRVHAFDAADGQFADALVSSSVIWFRRAKPDASSTVVFSGGPIETPSFSSSVRLRDLSAKEKWLKRCRPTVNRAVESRQTIGDLFKIRRGIATGSNPFFIRPVEEWDSLEVPRKLLVPVIPPSRALHSRVIEADSEGFAATEPKLALLDTRLPPSELEAKYPALWRYLNTEEGREVAQTYLSSSRSPWYSQEGRDPAPLICSYMGRGRNGNSPFKLFANRSNAIATNGYLMVYPRADIMALLKRKPEVLLSLRDSLEALVSEWYRDHGRVYGGGLHKLEPKELASIPADTIVREFDIDEALELALGA